MNEQQLPPLPEAWYKLYTINTLARPGFPRGEPGYTTEQMHAYARAALAAQGVPAGYAEMRSALLAVRTSIRFKSLSDEQRKLIDAALAATPAPAQGAPELCHFPQPRQQSKPCGECHLQPGERCDICGAKEPSPPQAQQAAVDHSMCPHQHSVDDWRLHYSGGPKP